MNYWIEKHAGELFVEDNKQNKIKIMNLILLSGNEFFVIKT